MNAQLWAEPIRSFQQVEWQLYPKMFGLAERSWNNFSALTLSDFTQLVYHYAIPELYKAGHNFHLPLPGIHVEGDTVKMNAVMQVYDGTNAVNNDKAVIEYSTDGGVEWNIYERSFVLNKKELPTVTDAYGTAYVLKARLRYLGHVSNTTWEWLK